LILSALHRRTGSGDVRRVYRNYDQSVVFTSVRNFYAPHNEAELVSILAAAQRSGEKIRAIGVAHNWNDISAPAPGGALLSMQHFNAIISVDSERRTSVVQAGIT
jgi:FAD/FMN-containing dehydrogenase